MALAKDGFTSDGVNTIYQTSNKYSPTTVTAKYITTSNEMFDLDVTELGENYIEVGIVPDGFKIVVEYNIIGTLPEDNQTEYDLKERIIKLEKAVEELFYINQAQKEALNNRLSVTAFKAWTKLIEKKTGIQLIEGDLNFISRELYK